MRPKFPTAALKHIELWLFPRQCLFCGGLLGADALHGTVCPNCAEEEAQLRHIPPRLPEGEHDFYAVKEAAAAYYYEGIVRSAILRCKRGGCPWFARELADRIAVLVFGVLPAHAVGEQPEYLGSVTMALYSCIVPVPPRQPRPGVPGLPLLLARRLGKVLGVPVETPLYLKNPGRPQKELTREERLRNAKGAFACQSGAVLSAKRVLLVDDIITTGATVSACAMALMQAGAVDVTVVSIAAAEERADGKGKTNRKRKKPSLFQG